MRAVGPSQNSLVPQTLNSLDHSREADGDLKRIYTQFLSNLCTNSDNHGAIVSLVNLPELVQVLFVRSKTKAAALGAESVAPVGMDLNENANDPELLIHSLKIFQGLAPNPAVACRLLLHTRIVSVITALCEMDATFSFADVRSRMMSAVKASSEDRFSPEDQEFNQTQRNKSRYSLPRPVPVYKALSGLLYNLTSCNDAPYWISAKKQHMFAPLVNLVFVDDITVQILAARGLERMQAAVKFFSSRPLEGNSDKKTSTSSPNPSSTTTLQISSPLLDAPPTGSKRSTENKDPVFDGILQMGQNRGIDATFILLFHQHPAVRACGLRLVAAFSTKKGEFLDTMLKRKQTVSRPGVITNTPEVTVLENFDITMESVMGLALRALNALKRRSKPSIGKLEQGRVRRKSAKSNNLESGDGGSSDEDADPEGVENVADNLKENYSEVKSRANTENNDSDDGDFLNDLDDNDVNHTKLNERQNDPDVNLRRRPSSIQGSFAAGGEHVRKPSVVQFQEKVNRSGSIASANSNGGHDESKFGRNRGNEDQESMSGRSNRAEDKSEAFTQLSEGIEAFLEKLVVSIDASSLERTISLPQAVNDLYLSMHVLDAICQIGLHSSEAEVSGMSGSEGPFMSEKEETMRLLRSNLAQPAVAHILINSISIKPSKTVKDLAKSLIHLIRRLGIRALRGFMSDAKGLEVALSFGVETQIGNNQLVKEGDVVMKMLMDLLSKSDIILKRSTLAFISSLINLSSPKFKIVLLEQKGLAAVMQSARLVTEVFQNSQVSEGTFSFASELYCQVLLCHSQGFLFVVY